MKAFLIDKSLRISNGSTVIHRKVFKHYDFPEFLRSAEDLPVFAYILANYPTRTLEQPLANIYKHEDSLRHNTTHAKNIGMSLGDEIFSPQRLGRPFQKLKRQYLGMRALSLFRTFYLAKQYSLAKKYFFISLKYSPAALLKLPYLRKFLKIAFK